MNLATLALLVGSVSLVSFVIVSSPAEANTAMPLSQSDLAELASTHHAVPLSVTALPDRPLIPTGCACARCVKAETLLQGQWPLN